MGPVKVDGTPKVKKREEKVLWDRSEKLFCEGRGTGSGTVAAREGAARGTRTSSLRLQGAGALGRLVAEPEGVLSGRACWIEETVTEQKARHHRDLNRSLP